MKWDLFICHATEDKDFVKPLVKALIKAGFSVWYDEFSMRLGDHLLRSIDKGLAQSRYGLVILSPKFFAKEWPGLKQFSLNLVGEELPLGSVTWQLPTMIFRESLENIMKRISGIESDVLIKATLVPLSNKNMRIIYHK